jgi:hypothetical protein
VNLRAGCVPRWDWAPAVSPGVLPPWLGSRKCGTRDFTESGVPSLVGLGNALPRRGGLGLVRIGAAAEQCVSSRLLGVGARGGQGLPTGGWEQWSCS